MKKHKPTLVKMELTAEAKEFFRQHALSRWSGKSDEEKRADTEIARAARWPYVKCQGCSKQIVRSKAVEFRPHRFKCQKCAAGRGKKKPRKPTTTNYVC